MGQSDIDSEIAISFCCQVMHVNIPRLKERVPFEHPSGTFIQMEMVRLSKRHRNKGFFYLDAGKETQKGRGIGRLLLQQGLPSTC